jgi:hypothetical protein
LSKLELLISARLGFYFIGLICFVLAASTPSSFDATPRRGEFWSINQSMWNKEIPLLRGGIEDDGVEKKAAN